METSDCVPKKAIEVLTCPSNRFRSISRFDAPNSEEIPFPDPAPGETLLSRIRLNWTSVGFVALVLRKIPMMLF
jgi:hypothetical protein